MKLFAIRIAFADQTTRDVTQEGLSAIDALSIVALRLHAHRPDAGPEVVSIALSNF